MHRRWVPVPGYSRYPGITRKYRDMEGHGAVVRGIPRNHGTGLGTSPVLKLGTCTRAAAASSSTISGTLDQYCSTGSPIMGVGIASSVPPYQGSGPHTAEGHFRIGVDVVLGCSPLVQI
eukprot:1510407-Rhodomonas_salina.2